MNPPIKAALSRVRLLTFLVVSTVALSATSAKDRWLKAENEHVILYSEASEKRTEELYSELNTTRALFTSLFPALTGETRNPLRVYIFKNKNSLQEISPMYGGKPMANPGFFSGDREGAYFCMAATGELDRIKDILNHEYIHFITRNRGYYLAPWASEGLAELYGKIEYKKIKGKHRILLGGVHEHRARQLRSESLLDFDTLFKTTRSSDLYRKSTHGQSMLYSQSWLLFHYLNFGKHDLGDDVSLRLVQLALSTPHPSEQQVQATLGIGYKELRKRLFKYARSGRFTQRYYDVPPETADSQLGFEEASEAEVHLIHGALLLSTRGPKAALTPLTRALEAAPDAPMALAYNGYFYMKRKDYESATSYFQKAIENGATSPATYLYHARGLLRSKNPRNKLNYGQYDIATSQAALKSLDKALELGGAFSPEVYAHYGEVYLASRLELNDEDFSIVVEGIKKFPDSPQLAFYIALYFERMGRYESALNVVKRFAPLAKGRNEANFKSLQERLLKKLQEKPRGAASGA